MTTETYILAHMQEPHGCFVFPSEVTARFWCRRALEMRGCASIAANRFLSWDQFKESCFVYPSDLRPANRAIRMLFVLEELERNRRDPHLLRIVPPRFAERPLVFVEQLQRLLPVLHRLNSVRSLWPRHSLDRLQDLEALHDAYRRFLEAGGLFEPNYLRPGFEAAGRRYTLFFPELVEDYPEFAELLAGRIETIPVPQTLRPDTRLRIHETLPEEIRSTVRRIAELLDRGVDAGQIVLTVGELEEVESLLRREAELFCLPLAIHLGKALTEFPQVRMLHRAYLCVHSCFSVQAMMDFLLCTSIPWKQQTQCRALIRLGLDSGIAGNTGSTDHWALSIEAARRQGNPRGLELTRAENFYNSLKTQLLSITTAESFAGLKEAIVSFVNNYLDFERLEEREKGIYRFAVDTLDDLEEARLPCAADPGSRMALRESAFAIWWSYLAQRRYVAPGADPGIPVFSFPLSEGMDPRHHFVINASQWSTRHRIRRYPFLKLHEEGALADVERDLSAAHLLLYSHSGQKVSFSFSRRDHRRANLPPPLFLERGGAAEVPMDPVDPRDPQDPYELERQAWIDATAFPLQQLQASGYRVAAALSGAGIDASRKPIRDRRLIQSLEQRLQDQNGSLRLSATALEQFNLCPFRFLIQRLLGVREEEFSPAMVEAMDVGRLLHRAAERFFRWPDSVHSARSGALLPSRRAAYRSRLRHIAGRVCAAHHRQNPAMLEPIAAEVRRTVQDLVLAFLDEELATMQEERLVGTEIELRARDPATGTTLIGKIDRLGFNPSGYTLIDYKKRSVPGRARIFSESPLSLQMPFYVHLLEVTGKPVTRAAYYSFEQMRYFFVFSDRDGGMGSDEEMRESVRTVQRLLALTRQRIAAGDYRVPAARTEECRRCRLTFLCRREYGLGG